MRSKVSRKKRKIIIVSSVVVMMLAILFLIWKLSSFTKSLKMDFDKIGLNCTGVTVFSDGSFDEVLSDGAIPDSLITDEVKEAVTKSDAEVCVVWLDYTIISDVELDENKFSVDIKPTRTALGTLYSYTPVKETKKDDNIYKFRQAILVDRVDVKNFLLEKELPRPFKGSCSFELSYCLKNSNKLKKVGFHADNLL